MSLGKNNKKYNAGFTIIESLVVVFVISMGLVAILSSVIPALDISGNIRDTFIASNLVQEGLEAVRAIRDRNWLLDSDPAPPNPFSGGLAGEWIVQWDSDSLTAIPLTGEPFLKIDSSGLYNYLIGADTVFRRKITIEEVNPDPDPEIEEMRIISEVRWTTKRGIPKVVRAESHLFNWR